MLLYYASILFNNISKCRGFIVIGLIMFFENCVLVGVGTFFLREF